MYLQYQCQKYRNEFINKNLILIYLQGFEVAELTESEMPSNSKRSFFITYDLINK
jgi:hypothetical protein